MALLIAFLVLWVLFIFLFWKYNYDWSEIWYLFILISFIGALFATMGLSELDRKEGESYYQECYKISSLRSQEKISGNFTLGCGNIEQQEYYYFFYQNENGYFSRDKTKTENTVIEENNSEKPRLDIVMNKIESRSGLMEWNDEETQWYRLVVPEGTVVDKFEVF